MRTQILDQTQHRLWPLPPGPWVMAQSWRDLLFAHWPISPQVLAPLLPPALTLDTFDGEAWVSIVPFRMADVRPRLAPAIPWLSHFLELNVRTYVRLRHASQPKPGVFFFSLEAANPVAVAVARRFFRLPYFNAHMRMLDDSRAIHYVSRRTHRGAQPASFAGRYWPVGPVFQAAPGTLEHWLTERYCFYTTDAAGLAYIGEIHHPPWPLQPAEAEIEENTMAAAASLALPAHAPLLHFARRLDILAWPLRAVRPANTRDAEEIPRA